MCILIMILVGYLRISMWNMSIGWHSKLRPNRRRIIHTITYCILIMKLSWILVLMGVILGKRIYLRIWRKIRRMTHHIGAAIRITAIGKFRFWYNWRRFALIWSIFFSYYFCSFGCLSLFFFLVFLTFGAKVSIFHTCYFVKSSCVNYLFRYIFSNFFRSSATIPRSKSNRYSFCRVYFILKKASSVIFLAHILR